MVSISYGQMRWVGWATLCSIENPEMVRPQDWVNQPAQVAGELALYFVLGLVLEFIYRKLAWGSGFTREEGVKAKCAESVMHEWHTFHAQNPPEDRPLDILCSDGKIRKGKTMATSLKGRLIFEIEYELEIRQEQQQDPMRFAPKYWRFSNGNDDKGDNDVF